MQGIVDYLVKAKKEFKNVTWPARPQAIRLTLLVAGGSLLVGLFVGGTDVVLLKGLNLALSATGN